MNSSPQEERITDTFNINVRRVKCISDHAWMGLLRCGRQGTTASVTPRKESEFREEMQIEKKTLLFSYFRKGNIIQKDRKRRLE